MIKLLGALITGKRFLNRVFFCASLNDSLEKITWCTDHKETFSHQDLFCCTALNDHLEKITLGNDHKEKDSHQHGLLCLFKSPH